MTYTFYLRQKIRKEAVAEPSFEICSFKATSCKTAAVLEFFEIHLE